MSECYRSKWKELLRSQCTVYSSVGIAKDMKKMLFVYNLKYWSYPEFE